MTRRSNQGLFFSHSLLRQLGFASGTALMTAVLGAKIKVPTPAGAVTVSVPKWSNTGRVLRLKGRGAPRSDGSMGDEYIKLMLMLPEKPDPKLEAFVAEWQPVAYSPRQAMGV